VFQAVFLSNESQHEFACAKVARRNFPVQAETTSWETLEGRASQRTDAERGVSSFTNEKTKKPNAAGIRSESLGQGLRGDCPYLASEFGDGPEAVET